MFWLLLQSYVTQTFLCLLHLSALIYKSCDDTPWKLLQFVIIHYIFVSPVSDENWYKFFAFWSLLCTYIYSIVFQFIEKNKKKAIVILCRLVLWCAVHHIIVSDNYRHSFKPVKSKSKVSSSHCFAIYLCV